MVKPVGVIFLILSLFASAVGQMVSTCTLSGSCLTVVVDDCWACAHHHHHHHHHEEDVPSVPADEEEHPVDDSGRPHDHHHCGQVATPSVLPSNSVSLSVPELLQCSFVFLQARPAEVPPYELEQPPRS